MPPELSILMAFATVCPAALRSMMPPLRLIKEVPSAVLLFSVILPPVIATVPEAVEALVKVSVLAPALVNPAVPANVAQVVFCTLVSTIYGPLENVTVDAVSPASERVTVSPAPEKSAALPFTQLVVLASQMVPVVFQLLSLLASVLVRADAGKMLQSERKRKCLAFMDRLAHR